MMTQSWHAWSQKLSMRMVALKPYHLARVSAHIGI